MTSGHEAFTRDQLIRDAIARTLFAPTTLARANAPQNESVRLLGPSILWSVLIASKYSCGNNQHG
ncbi:MAG: hypothetical protein Q8N23_04175 [Archangium sp.]|nr:hypothetical protein [Archangium sp.]MDP3569883.1 hypothetical protein [Archangium sp.]